MTTTFVAEIHVTCAKMMEKQQLTRKSGNTAALKVATQKRSVTAERLMQTG